jgi:hypothetical protein
LVQPAALLLPLSSTYQRILHAAAATKLTATFLLQVSKVLFVAGRTRGSQLQTSSTSVGLAAKHCCLLIAPATVAAGCLLLPQYDEEGGEDAPSGDSTPRTAAAAGAATATRRAGRLAAASAAAGRKALREALKFQAAGKQKGAAAGRAVGGAAAGALSVTLKDAGQTAAAAEDDAGDASR